MGVRPRVELARAAGLPCDRGVLVDEYLRAGDPDIYAAGDIAEAADRSGHRTLQVLWNPALLKGRVAGLNMATEPVHAYEQDEPINVTRLAGLHTTIIGLVGSGTDADLEGLSRGDSEVWSELSDQAIVESERGDAHVRLTLGEHTIAGAVVMGDQTLSFPLQDLIEGHADVTGAVAALEAPGAPIVEIVNGLWADWKAGRAGTAPAARPRGGAMSTEAETSAARGAARRAASAAAGDDRTAVVDRGRAPATRPAGRGRELWYALAAIVAVTALYGVAYNQAGHFPTASGWVGHGIGIAGFVLMLMTATLYSLRKLRGGAAWGPTASWLRFHMVTGLVGPYMVLLHTAMRFSGLAGVTMLLTVLVVASGLVGRFLYTRVPRSPEAGARRRALATWHQVHLPLTWALFALAIVHMVAALYYATLAP